MADANQAFLEMFADPDRVAAYAEGPRRFVPGFDALHRMAAILLAEHAPTDARVLVLGAGGGLELKAFAAVQPGWRFTGVDPAAPMLDLARRTLGSEVARADLVEGYIDDAPMGPFDTAACLLTLHFLNWAERVRTLSEIRRRLRPGAPLVVAHSSFPQDESARTRWITRYAAFAIASGADPDQVEQARAAVAASLVILAPGDDEQCFAEAGFIAPEMFYAAFSWRGWVMRA